MMIRSIEMAIFFRTPNSVAIVSDLVVAFRDVLLVDFLSGYTSVSSDAGRGS